MMSAPQNPTTLESQLEALQCHFTWDLDPGRSKLFRVRDRLEDIGTEEGNSWLGHIYNLRGYIQYKLGFTEDAQSLFNKATEAFLQTRKGSDEGPWLVVNYGNLAWLHHHLGEQKQSQTYLSKVDDLMNKYPSPSQDELHAEIYAEKAWTLMNFNKDKKLLATDCFQKAIKMQPDKVEWNTSYFIGLAKCDESELGLEADILEEMRIAKEQNPGNLYLAVHYLDQRAKKGENIKDEACELAEKVLRNPVSSYSGMKTLLWVHRKYLSVDEAIKLAEEALKNHPDVRYLKSCAALCYKWMIFQCRDRLPDESMIDRAISLHEEVIPLYPHSSLVKKIDLANIYAKSNRDQTKAEKIYQELLETDLEDADKQMLYNRYAHHSFFCFNDSEKSKEYHKMAVEIPHQSFYRENSLKILKKMELQELKVQRTRGASGKGRFTSSCRQIL